MGERSYSLAFDNEVNMSTPLKKRIHDMLTVAQYMHPGCTTILDASGACGIKIKDVKLNWSSFTYACDWHTLMAAWFKIMHEFDLLIEGDPKYKEEADVYRQQFYKGIETYDIDLSFIALVNAIKNLSVEKDRGIVIKQK